MVHSPPPRKKDQPLAKQKRTKKRKVKQTIGLLITLTCNQLADAITFYGVVLIVTVAFLSMFFFCQTVTLITLSLTLNP